MSGLIAVVSKKWLCRGYLVGGRRGDAGVRSALLGGGGSARALRGARRRAPVCRRQPLLLHARQPETLTSQFLDRYD